MKVALCLYQGAVPSGLFALSELLIASNRISGKPIFEVEWVSINCGSKTLQAQAGLPLAHAQQVRSLEEVYPSAILLPGFWLENAGRYTGGMKHRREVISALSNLPSRTSILAYCTAVGLVAEARLLTKKSAACTWWLADEFAQRYPSTHWQFENALVKDGQITTAAGLNGYLPIAADLIKTQQGAEVWQQVEELMVLPKPREAMPPFAALKQLRNKDPLLQKLFHWTETQRADSVRMAELANHLSLSERTLARRVQALASLSPGKLVRMIKLMQAGEFLRFSSNNIATISEQLGFGDDTMFRRSFKHSTGLTPQAFRLRYR